MNRIRKQYENEENLKTRISIHDRYSTNPQPFGAWILSHYDLQPGFRILELGCGTGEMWKGRLDLLDGGSRLVLTDFSAGMLEAARGNLGDDPRLDYRVVDIREIPWPDDAFDVVIANMMLYHVPELDRGLSEVRRVLKPGGVFYCATYGEHGIMAFINEALKDHHIHGGIGGTFTLQNGAQALSRHFDQVERLTREDGLAITHIPDFVEYVRSLSGISGLEQADDALLLRSFGAKAVDGVLYVPKEYGMFVCGGEKPVETAVIEAILKRYGFPGDITAQKTYLRSFWEKDRMKLIFRVTLADGRRLVIKLLREEDDLAAERSKGENQSIFSERMRAGGIRTPARYLADGNHCSEWVYHGRPCLVTVEDWCGEEIQQITTDIARRIGGLMARMHTLSLERGYTIGHGTLFSAAYWNDVDCFPQFCEITKDEKLDQDVVGQIKRLREEKLERIRTVWQTLPRAAVQGDISINNLVDAEDGLIVFDYNNAGDEVLVSDLVMEGLLTAYEMDLPEGVPESYRERLFPELLDGYLSVRPLSQAECGAAWEIYTLYHGLWFTRIVYRDDALEALVKRRDYESANRLLKRMLADMMETDDGRFRR